MAYWLSLQKAKGMIKVTKRQDSFKLTSRMHYPFKLTCDKVVQITIFETYQLSPHEVPQHTWRDTTSVSLPQQPWLLQEHPCRDIDLPTHSSQNWSPADKTSSILQQVYLKPSHPSGLSDQSGNLTVHKGLIALKIKWYLVTSSNTRVWWRRRGQETQRERVKKYVEGGRGKNKKEDSKLLTLVWGGNRGAGNLE